MEVCLSRIGFLLVTDCVTMVFTSHRWVFSRTDGFLLVTDFATMEQLGFCYETNGYFFVTDIVTMELMGFCS